MAGCFDICQYVRVTVSQPTRPLPLADDACCGTGADTGLSAEQAERAAALLKALADPVRLRLWSRIAASQEPVCVCDLGDVGVSQPTVSHHLRKLRDSGLIDCERRGTWVYYWMVPGALTEATDVLAGAPTAG